jgi:hypothetical protein
LPPEFSTRYQQQFVDRLWMRGLFAVCGLYLIGVVIYFAALGYATFRTTGVENQVASLSDSYTNVVQLKARCQVLEDRQELKYAALEIWKTIAELKPESLMLDSMSFSDGKRLTLSGTVPAPQVQDELNFEGALRSATNNDGQLLFDNTKETENSKTPHQGGSIAWSFRLELNRPELQ